MPKTRFYFLQALIVLILAFLFFIPNLSRAQVSIPTPTSVFGFKVGTDYHLIDYEQSVSYFKKLAAASDRMKLVKVGYTNQGRPWYMSIISTPENLNNLDHYRQINMKIAHPKGINPEKAHQLTQKGVIFVDINGGLHATEIAGSQHTNQLAYNLLSSGKKKFQKRFNKMVLFLWPTLNPDGQDIVVHWYRKIKDSKKYRNAPLHRLYEDYVGHDDDRDGFMLNTQEARVEMHTWRHWEPEIIHVHHQYGKGFGKDGNFHRMWLPPFAPPVGEHTPYLMLREMNALGMRMSMELESHGDEGAMSMGAGYDAYYPGYNDYVGMYQNIVSYWTEVASSGYANPAYLSPDTVKKYLKSYRPRALYSSVWKGGWWRLSDQVNYMLAADYGVLKFATNNRKEILYNRYKAGTNAIKHYSNHAPYGYIIPQKQRDPAAAVQMLRRLAFNGVRVDQLTKAATLNGTSYPAGTWVIPMGQEYGRLAQEVLEVQHYPDIVGKDDALEQPYDVAAWTLPYAMGVNVVTAKQPLPDAFRSAMKPVKGTPVAWDASKKASLQTNAVAAGIVAPKGTLTGSGASLALNPAENNSFALINRALAAGGTVHYSSESFGHMPGGHYVVSGVSQDSLKAWVNDLALHARWTGEASGAARHPRIGIYSSYLGYVSIDEGWTRWVLDQYGFKYQRIRNKQMKAGNLNKRFDVIVLASIGSRSLINGYSSKRMPAPYAGGIGQEGVKALKTFVKNGGTLICLNRSSRFAIQKFNLPVKNVVAGLHRDQFFVGGSFLKITVNQSNQVMAGMPSRANVFFMRSPAFEPLANFQGTVLATYPRTDSLLLSGYLKGGDYLKGHAAALDAHVGDGHVILFGFRPQWRGQMFGQFKMLFNALFVQ